MTTISILDLANVTGGADPKSLVKGDKGGIQWRNPANDRLSPRNIYPTGGGNGYRKGDGTKGQGGWGIG